MYIHTHTHNGTQSQKKKKTSFAATWINLESAILGKVSQGQISHDITYIWNFKKTIQSKLYTKQK